jgi:hypothetical protein
VQDDEAKADTTGLRNCRCCRAREEILQSLDLKVGKEQQHTLLCRVADPRENIFLAQSRSRKMNTADS